MTLARRAKYVRTKDLAVEVRTVDFRSLAVRIQPPEGLLRCKWQQHTNPDGTIGGWVETTANVADSVFVDPNAIVMDSACVLESARIRDSALISGWAVICGSAVVAGNAVVTDEAHVGGSCRLGGTVVVRGASALDAGVFCEGELNEPMRPDLPEQQAQGYDAT
jgi:carbonic anhydrase/acetyltransferase-like protein (isoleucine patch superfamily)